MYTEKYIIVSHPAISVIIPTYNRSHLLPRSIGSVLSQEFSDFELFVIDDGSSDDTSKVVSSWNDPRLHYVRFEQNLGIGAARNAGVAQATGDWLAFLDSDDKWLSNKLLIDTNILKYHPEIDLLFDNYRNINYVTGLVRIGFEDTQPAFRYFETVELSSGVFRVISGFPNALLRMNPIGTSSVVTVRRTVFEELGNFHVALRGTEDFEFYWRLGMAKHVIAYQQRVLVERHKDTDSVSYNAITFVPEMIKALEICEATACRYDQTELLPDIRSAKRLAYNSQLRAYARTNQRLESLNAFRTCMQYGLSMKSIIYLLAAWSGVRVVDLWYWLRKKMRMN